MPVKWMVDKVCSSNKGYVSLEEYDKRNKFDGITVKSLKELVTDENEFLERLPRETISKVTGTFISWDIESMFSNIDNSLAIKAVFYWFTNYKDEIDDRFTWPFLRDCILFILNNNTFTFNSRHFKQLIGILLLASVTPSPRNFLRVKLVVTFYENSCLYS